MRTAKTTKTHSLETGKSAVVSDVKPGAEIKYI
jgi:hypothetical protein